jgi:hypothetical protein
MSIDALKRATGGAANRGPARNNEEQEVVIQGGDVGALVALQRAEVDQQITTAKAYPRSIRGFMDEARELVTLTEEIAESCIYALPRKEKGETKMIEGPSARFAEMIASSWGNCRAGARVVAEEREFIVSQGVFHDLEKNVSITFEVKRRITGRDGRRFSSDMIAVTGNAASSIALRNAVLKGIPKALWDPLYQEARKAAVGDVKTLANKRSDMFAYFQKLGVQSDAILAKMGVKGIEDIGLDELATLKGIATAIKEGEITPEAAFARDREEAAATSTAGKFGAGAAPGETGGADPTPGPEVGGADAKGEPEVGAPIADAASLMRRAEAAKDVDELAEIQDLARELGDADRKRVQDAAKARTAELTGSTTRTRGQREG